MRLPKIREVAEAVSALLHRPYTSPFPREPHRAHAKFRGQPKFDPDHCVGCLACEKVCPVEALGHRDEVSNGTGRRILIHYTDTCIFCGCCEAACIADHRGIRLSTDWDLAFFDRATQSFETIEKELALCEACGAVIACRDHLRWIAERLGELAFSSPTLFQARLATLGVVDENIVASLRDQGRSDRMKILCARCRRQTTLTTG